MEQRAMCRLLLALCHLLKVIYANRQGTTRMQLHITHILTEITKIDTNINTSRETQVHSKMEH